MESVAALSLASNIIQIVDFCSRIISRGHELYNSAHGMIEEHVVVEGAARNLSELYQDLHISCESGTSWKRRRIPGSDQQLMELKAETEKVVNDISSLLNKVRPEVSHGRWQSLHQALRSISTDKKLSALVNRLNDLRQQTNTAILVFLRNAVDHSTKRQISGTMDSYDDSHGGAKHRHAELLSAIRENNWHASNHHDITAFSEKLSSHMRLSLEEKFRTMLLARLYFRHMADRMESIPVAHSKTFEWLFENDQPSNDESQWSNFEKWLQNKDGSIYWISGKPGSGKSTLMKYVYYHRRLTELLGAWAKASKLTKAGFYFWNSGSTMQMSRLGLLQALVHKCVSERDVPVVTIFAERWEQFVAFGGGQDPFDWPELLRALNRVISDQSRQFFFLIDGLDEFDGRPEDIIQFIRGIAKPNVKLCVASRPWLPFQDAFKEKPSLRLERLTKTDISTYINDHFLGNEHYIRLLDYEPIAAKALLHEVVDKACGVFLWVYLVVQSLLEGMSNEDSMSHLKARLDALPSDLEALFDVILDRVQKEYFRHACELFRLLRSHRETLFYVADYRRFSDNPSLLGLCFAEDADLKSSVHAARQPLSIKEASRRADQMARRLNAHCKGLLEVHTAAENQTGIKSRDTSGTYDGTVCYLHRTARDYVESQDYWEVVLQWSGHASFQPDARWANAKLWLHKAHPMIYSEYECSKNLEDRCFDSAITTYARTGIIQATYLNEVFRCRNMLQGTEDDKTSLELWSARLGRISPSRSLDSCVVLLTIASPADRTFMLKIAELFLAQHTRDNSKASLKALKNLRKAYAYHTAPANLRWAHRRPHIPSYE